MSKRQRQHRPVPFERLKKGDYVRVFENVRGPKGVEVVQRAEGTIKAFEPLGSAHTVAVSALGVELISTMSRNMYAERV